MFLETLGDFVLGVFVEVAVHVHLDADARMAEVLLDVPRVCVGSDEERCAGVTQVMHPVPILVNLGDRRQPHVAVEVRLPKRCLGVRGEHKTVRVAIGEESHVDTERIGDKRRDRDRPALPRLRRHRKSRIPPDETCQAAHKPGSTGQTNWHSSIWSCLGLGRFDR